MKTAIILGATGLTGGKLLEKLLQDNRYSKIKIFSRRPLAAEHPKIEQHIVDLLQMENEKTAFFADEVYCCVGSTEKKTPNLENYRNVDYGIPLTAAKIAKANGIDTFLVISALGANPKSRFFYPKTKGEMERDLLQLEIENTYIFQPGLIDGKRPENRFLEDLSKKIMRVANIILIGPIKKYRSIHPEIIAKAMIICANSGYWKKRIPSNEIKELVNNER